jgi:hypothetical protein
MPVLYPTPGFSTHPDHIQTHTIFPPQTRKRLKRIGHFIQSGPAGAVARPARHSAFSSGRSPGTSSKAET